MNELMIRGFHLSRGGQSISCTETRQQALDGRQLPAVILCHGFGGCKKHLEPMRDRFAQMGYDVFCFDFCGGGLESESDGMPQTMTITSECEDLEVLLRHVRQLDQVDPARVILLGESQGGLIAGLTAARHTTEEIAALILFYPALCIPDHARQGRLGGARYDPSNVPDFLPCPNGMTLGKCFHDDVVSMDPYMILPQYQGPVLILQGMKDPIVHYTYAIRAKACYRENQCALMLIRQAGHGFDPALLDSAFASIRQFLHHKRELMTIQVFVTGAEELEPLDGARRTAVYFTGYCDCDLFRGTIQPGAVDLQTHTDGGETVLHAEYTLSGLDAKGNACTLSVVNEKKGEDYAPVVTTDSAELQWMQKQPLTAVLEGFDGGLTVRIFGCGDSFRKEEIHEDRID